MEKQLKISLELLKIEKVICVKGFESKISVFDKILYSYLKDYYEISCRTPFLITHKELSEVFCVAEKTVNRAVSFLEAVGLIDKDIKFYKNLPKNVYKQVYDFLVLPSGFIKSKKYLGVENAP